MSGNTPRNGSNENRLKSNPGRFFFRPQTGSWWWRWPWLACLTRLARLALFRGFGWLGWPAPLGGLAGLAALNG